MVFDDVIAAPLAEKLAKQGEQTRFSPYPIDGVGIREIADAAVMGAVMATLLDRPGLREWMAHLADLPPLRGVTGAFAQTRAGSGDHLDWHDDMNEPHRALGVVVNLGTTAYEGGVFELRRKGATEPMFVHQHDRLGSMAVFSVHADLEHRVTPVTAGGPRRVYAGWFQASHN